MLQFKCFYLFFFFPPSGNEWKPTSLFVKSPNLATQGSRYPFTLLAVLTAIIDRNGHRTQNNYSPLKVTLGHLGHCSVDCFLFHKKNKTFIVVSVLLKTENSSEASGISVPLLTRLSAVLFRAPATPPRAPLLWLASEAIWRCGEVL